MEYVCDAHTLLWHLFAPQRLGSTARTILQDADRGLHRVFVPAVVLAEMIMVVQRGRLPQVSLPELLTHINDIEAGANYVLLPLEPATVITSHTLTAIPDIFDRLVVTEAQRLGLPLLSRDRTIAEAGVVDTVWE